VSGDCSSTALSIFARKKSVSRLKECTAPHIWQQSCKDYN
jgi:hypothetical protein